MERTQFPLACTRWRAASASFFSMKSAGRGRADTKELMRRAACVGVVSRGFSLGREEKGKRRGRAGSALPGKGGALPQQVWDRG